MIYKKTYYYFKSALSHKLCDDIIKFVNYRYVSWKDCLDENYINWVATSSKVDWQRELATKELKRRRK